MYRDESTPTRTRTIMEEAYVNAGFADFQFIVYQPFTAEHFEAVTKVGASPQGVANQVNQVLAENLGNSMAALVRAAVKNGTPLPIQEDMDKLYDEYEFSGVRRSKSGLSPNSLLVRIFYRLAGSFIKRLLKKKGYQEMAAPVTVAKRGEEPVGNQISFETFEGEVERLVEGDGPWGEVEAFISVRNDLYEDAKTEEAATRAREVAAESKLAALGQ